MGIKKDIQFFYLFGELIASTTLESYKYKQKFRLKLKRSK